MAWVLDKNSSGYMEAVTLGNILAANKIRIVCENVTWNTTGYLFSQANTFSSNRELGLYIFSSTVRFYIGGVNNATGVSISPANETVDFTVDFTAGTALLVVGESTVFSGSASIGSNRVDGELFRFFGRNGGFLAPEGTQIGKVSIYIDDVLVRYYDPDSSDRSGSTDQPILIDTIGGNNATGVNFSPYDPNVWVNLGGGVTRLSRDISLVTGFSQRLVHDTTINTALLERKSNDVTLSTSLLERKSNDTQINTGLLTRLTRDTEIEFSLLTRLSRTTQIQTAFLERKSRDYDVAFSLLERKIRNTNIVTGLLNRFSNDIAIETGMLSAKSRDYTISFALLERKESSVVIQFSIEGDTVPRVQLTPKAIPTVQLTYLADETQVVQITPITPTKIQLQ